MMTRLAALTLSLLMLAPVAADESIGLEFPVEDARAAVAEGRYEFAAIELEEGLEFPGLTPAQIERVQQDYDVRHLNHRRQTFANVETRQDELRRMRAYALRYNLMMWKAIDARKVRDFKKYRY